MAKVFISWSGPISQRIGEALRDWLPSVLQSVRPYFTPVDIEKGARWASEIKAELEASKLGIFVLTKENTKSQWLHFEAGAISREIGTNSVCPLLFGIEPTDIVGPLSQFQSTTFSRDEAHKLVSSINTKLGEGKLSAGTLENVFNKWWPDLETQINAILSESASKSAETVRSDRELIEEIVEYVRTARQSMPTARMGEDVLTTIRTLDPIIFARYSDASFTEKQILALRKFDGAAAFDMELSEEVASELGRIVATQRKKLEGHLKELKAKKPDLDDDIPF